MADGWTLVDFITLVVSIALVVIPLVVGQYLAYRKKMADRDRRLVEAGKRIKKLEGDRDDARERIDRLEHRDQATTPLIATKSVRFIYGRPDVESTSRDILNVDDNPVSNGPEDLYAIINDASFEEETRTAIGVACAGGIRFNILARETRGGEEGLSWLKSIVGEENVKTNDPGRIRLLIRRDKVLLIVEDLDPEKYMGLYVQGKALAEDFLRFWNSSSEGFG